MLTGITVKDYTTFIGETHFDFRATSYKILEETNVGANRVLKGALFVGENASGKTKILDAICFLLKLLFEEGKEIELGKFKNKSFYTKGDKYKLTYYFELNNKEIKYEIEFEKNSIISENLLLDGKNLLSRIKTNGKTSFTDEDKTPEVAADLLLLRQEYYHTRLDNHKLLNEWIDYLKNAIYINCVHRSSQFFNSLNIEQKHLKNHLQKNKDLSEINSMLKKINYSSSFTLVKEEGTTNEELCMIKNGTNINVPLKLESSGNIALANVILSIIYATKNDCLLIIDEFSSGLHNELEESLIRYFFDNSKNSQLFFASHSTNILDNMFLRPDQIYSFRFDSKKGTLIERFSNENPRESQNIEKMYLDGVFNGKPNYRKDFKN